MQAIICLIALVLLFNATLSGAQEDGSPFVRLATYWDSPGDVKAISADDRWMVITDHATEISRLVEIATGDILTEQPRNDVIYFSPDGRFASVYDVASGNIQIIDLARKAVTYEERVGRILIRFRANSRYGVAGFTDSERQNYHVQVMNLETGEVLIDVPGWNEALSPLVFYVLGQTADGEWLYGTGMLNERREGWLRASHLTMVKPYDNVPVLDAADPLRSLYEVSTSKP